MVPIIRSKANSLRVVPQIHSVQSRCRRPLLEGRRGGEEGRRVSQGGGAEGVRGRLLSQWRREARPLMCCALHCEWRESREMVLTIVITTRGERERERQNSEGDVSPSLPPLPSLLSFLSIFLLFILRYLCFSLGLFIGGWGCSYLILFPIQAKK